VVDKSICLFLIDLVSIDRTNYAAFAFFRKNVRTK